MSAYDMRLRYAGRAGDGPGIKWRELRYRGPMPHRGDTIRIKDGDGEVNLEVTGVRINVDTIVVPIPRGHRLTDLAVAGDVVVTCRRLWGESPR